MIRFIQIVKLLILFIGLQCVGFNFLFSQVKIIQASLKDSTTVPQRVSTLLGVSGDMVRNNPLQARRYAMEALALSQKDNYGAGIARSYNSLGVIYRYRANYDSAFSYYKMAFDLYETFEDKIGMAEVLKNMGNIFYFRGDNDKALEHYLNSLSLFESLNNKEGVAEVSSNLGSFYRLQHEFDLAFSYYLKALGIFEALGKDQSVGRTYNNIGNLYEKEEKYGKALRHYEMAAEIWQEVDDKNGMARTFTNLGRVYPSLDSLKGVPIALGYFFRALEIQKTIGDRQGIAFSSGQIGNCYLKQKKYDLAIEYLKQQLQIAKDINHLRLIHTAYKELAETYKEKGESEQAYIHLHSYIEISDTLFFREKTASMQDIREKYESEKRDNEIKSLKVLNEAESRNSENILWFFSVLTILFAILLMVSYNLSRLRKRINFELEQKVQERTANLETTASQLEKTNLELDNFLYRIAHDLRGPVATLQGLCDISGAEVKSEKALSYIGMKQKVVNRMQILLDEVIRVGSIRNHARQHVDISLQDQTQDLLEEMSDMDGFQQVDIRYDFPSDTHFDTDPFLLNIIMRNLIKNSIENRSEKTSDSYPWIEIQYEKENEVNYLNIRDNGVGISSKIAGKVFGMFYIGTTKPSGFGLGLYQAKIAIERLNGKIELVDSDSKGTHIRMMLPENLGSLQA